MPEKDVEFKKEGKHYIAKWTEMRSIHTTVVENEGLYTKVEIQRAKEAYDLSKNAGYPSQTEAIHLLQDGNIYGLPLPTKDDIH